MQEHSGPPTSSCAPYDSNTEFNGAFGYVAHIASWVVVIGPVEGIESKMRRCLGTVQKGFGTHAVRKLVCDGYDAKSTIWCVLDKDQGTRLATQNLRSRLP